MTKQELMQEIDGYAVAKATGFPLLIERQLAVLQTLSSVQESIDERLAPYQS